MNTRMVTTVLSGQDANFRARVSYRPDMGKWVIRLLHLANGVRRLITALSDENAAIDLAAYLVNPNDKTPEEALAEVLTRNICESPEGRLLDAIFGMHKNEEFGRVTRVYETQDTKIALIEEGDKTWLMADDYVVWDSVAERQYSKITSDYRKWAREDWAMLTGRTVEKFDEEYKTFHG